MALLGSNHARNNAAAQDAKDWADTIRPFLLRIVAQCQEKPIDEAFPASSVHATVIVDVAFQISEDSPEPVVRVGHAINQLPGVPSHDVSHGSNNSSCCSASRIPTRRSRILISRLRAVANSHHSSLGRSNRRYGICRLHGIARIASDSC